jgi:transcriptional regulator NrdR family protein
VAEPERARREVGGGWREQAERLGRGCEEIACRLSILHLASFHRGTASILMPICDMKKTRIYCPGCNLLTVRHVKDEVGSYRIREKRVTMKGHVDIQLFQRIRHCSNCGHAWRTSEVDHSLIEELVELRSAVESMVFPREMLKNVWNKWIEKSEVISDLITSLGTSLSKTAQKRESSKKHQLAIKQRQEKTSLK